MPNSDAKIHYSVRRSKRAKYLRLYIHPCGTVEVVLPVGMQQHHADLFVEEKRGWILNHLHKVKNDTDTPSKEEAVLPETITLRAIEQTFSLIYTESHQRGVRIQKQDARTLQIYGYIDDHMVLHQALCHWLKCYAKEHLLSWLQRLAQTHEVEISSSRIRLQKKRWGSCSTQKNINLNAKLLFLPPKLVEHVMLHEIAHLTHLNHSPQFWALVAKMDKDYKDLRQQMRHATQFLPKWVPY
ncbi:MAG: SprT family zinc-dependent metalloprotease [Mariprofundaceae bacterium]